jgi:hypothetical protein
VAREWKYRETLRRFVTPWRIVIVVPIFVHLAAFCYGVSRPEVRWMADTAEYLSAGRNLLHNGVLYAGDLSSQPLDPALYSRRPPLYPVFLAVAEQLPGGLHAAAFLQLVLTFTVAFLAYRLTRRLLPERFERWAVAVPALVLLYPTQVIYSQILMSEILLQFCLTVAAFELTRYLREGKVAALWSANGALALAPLVKPVMVFFWVPNLAFLWWIHRRSGLRRWCVPALLPLLLVVAWSCRNLYWTGSFHFSSMAANQAKVLVQGPEPLDSRGKDLGDDYKRLLSQFLQQITAQPARFVRAQMRGMGSFFLDPGMFDLYEFLNRERPFSLGQIIFSEGQVRRIPADLPASVLTYLTGLTLLNLFVVVGFLLFCFLQPVRLPAAKWFLVLIVVYMAVVVGPIGRSRYRLPVEPFLFIGAACAMSQGIRRGRKTTAVGSKPRRDA